MQKGKIIFLNGVSSSGKTTLAKALQAKLEKPFYLLGNDMFCDMSPEKFWDIDWRETSYRVLTGMYHTIKTFSDIGINVIVDDVLLKEDDRLQQCAAILHDHPVLFVHVICSDLDELRRREKERGDRGIGQGESQLAELNPQDNIYDTTVDTFETSTEECAGKIIELLDCPEKFTAFKILWERFKTKN
ncbi:MAG: chloramphenicol phosphotransferase CPT family protein [Oscillospiraceae bacterium]|nr:chloramphenicol phosphotransferase CPT family protein [Oscillospiraceae bacterium]